jgi:hypothetical protein
MVASIASGCGGKGLFRGSRARKKPSPLRPGGGFFIVAESGRHHVIASFTTRTAGDGQASGEAAGASYSAVSAQGYRTPGRPRQALVAMTGAASAQRRTLTVIQM